MSVYGKIIVQKKQGGDGTQFVLTALSCVIGRDNESDIRLVVDGVSREHCQLVVRENGEVYLANLSKSGSTLRNGIPIIDPVPLHHLDVFSVCGRSFRWEFTPEYLNSKYTNANSVISPNTLKKFANRHSTKKTTKKTKSPVTRITPKRRRKSSLIAMEKMTTDGVKNKSPAALLKTKKLTNLEKQPPKSKKNLQKAKKSFNFKVVSTKVKKPKVKPTNKSTKIDLLSSNEESLSVSDYNTPNITQDIFISPLCLETSLNKSSIKRKSPRSVDVTSAKKKRLSVKRAEASPSPLKKANSSLRNATPQKKETIPETPLSSRKTAKGKANRKKQNTPVPDYSNVEGMKRLFRQSGPLPDYRNIVGLKRLFNAPTPKADYTGTEGIKKLFSKTNTPDYRNVGGLKRLQSRVKSPNLNDLSGMAELFNSPASDNTNVKRVMRNKTPKSAKATVNTLRKVLRKSLSSPKSPTTVSPRKLTVTPRSKSSSPAKKTPSSSSKASKSPAVEKLEATKANAVSPSPRKGLKRLSSPPAKSSSPTKRMSLDRKASPKMVSPKSPIANPRSKKEENVLPLNEDANSTNTTPARKTRNTRRAVKTPSPKAFSPRKTRSATKTPRGVKTPQKENEAVQATPTRSARRPTRKAAETKAPSPPKSPKMEVAKKSRAKKEVTESAKTPKGRAAASPSKRKSPVKAKENEPNKFELTLTPIKEVKTPKSTRTRRKVVAATSPVGRVLRRSKRT